MLRRRNSMRYEKQVKVIGEKGQECLFKSKVLIVGMGAHGTVVAELFARSGIGEIHMIDGDLVEETNLQRQSLYTESDALDSIPKVFAAEEKLSKINRNVQFYPLFAELTDENAEEYFKGMDIIIDGTDNPETRYTINDTCIRLNIPWIYGASVGTQGSFFAFVPERTPCFRCVFGDEITTQLTCSSFGVLSSMTHQIGCLQFNEAMKVLTENISLLNDTITQMDIWNNQQNNFSLKKRKNCICQGYRKPIVKNNHQKPYNVKVLCGKDVVMFTKFTDECSASSPQEYFNKKLQSKNINFKENEYFTSARIQGNVVRCFKDGRVYVYADQINEAETIFKKIMS